MQTDSFNVDVGRAKGLGKQRRQWSQGAINFGERREHGDIEDLACLGEMKVARGPTFHELDYYEEHQKHSNFFSV